jgi:hypothetical protein
MITQLWAICGRFVGGEAEWIMVIYTVTAERSGDWWVLQADEAPGAISQVRSLDEIGEIREAIAFVTGQPESEVEVRLAEV